MNVSNGPAEVNVPYVIGMSVQQATQTLQAAGFQAQVQSFGLGNNDGRVWDYSPVGQAPRGSIILLDVLTATTAAASRAPRAKGRRRCLGLCLPPRTHPGRRRSDEGRTAP